MLVRCLRRTADVRHARNASSTTRIAIVESAVQALDSRNPTAVLSALGQSRLADACVANASVPSAALRRLLTDGRKHTTSRASLEEATRIAALDALVAAVTQPVQSGVAIASFAELAEPDAGDTRAVQDRKAEIRSALADVTLWPPFPQTQPHNHGVSLAPMLRLRLALRLADDVTNATAESQASASSKAVQHMAFLDRVTSSEADRVPPSDSITSAFLAVASDAAMRALVHLLPQDLQQLALESGTRARHLVASHLAACGHPVDAALLGATAFSGVTAAAEARTRLRLWSDVHTACTGAAPTAGLAAAVREAVTLDLDTALLLAHAGSWARRALLSSIEKFAGSRDAAWWRPQQPSSATAFVAPSFSSYLAAVESGCTEAGAAALLQWQLRAVVNAIKQRRSDTAGGQRAFEVLAALTVSNAFRARVQDWADYQQQLAVAAACTSHPRDSLGGALLPLVLLLPVAPQDPASPRRSLYARALQVLSEIVPSCALMQRAIDVAATAVRFFHVTNLEACVGALGGFSVHSADPEWPRRAEALLSLLTAGSPLTPEASSVSNAHASAGAIVAVVVDVPRLAASLRVQPPSSVVNSVRVIHMSSDVAFLWKPAGLTATPQLQRSGVIVPSLLCSLWGSAEGRAASLAVEQLDPAQSHPAVLRRGGAVQRLDFGTSGCVAVALNEPAASTLRASLRQTAQRGVRWAHSFGPKSTTGRKEAGPLLGSAVQWKQYVAICVNTTDAIFTAASTNEVVDDPSSNFDGAIWTPSRSNASANALRPRRSSGGAFVASPHADAAAVSHFEVLRTTRDGGAGALILIQCRIATGRKNQIRSHLSTLGLPILNDAKFGGPAAASTLCGGRLALHLKEQAYTVPAADGSVERMVLSVRMPADMQDACHELNWSTGLEGNF